MFEKKRDWTPVRTEEIYCSPACGGKCKYSKFEAATKAADELCKTMGEKWKPRVWENLGWHWCIEHTNGNATMRFCSSEYETEIQLTVARGVQQIFVTDLYPVNSFASAVVRATQIINQQKNELDGLVKP